MLQRIRDDIAFEGAQSIPKPVIPCAAQRFDGALQTRDLMGLKPWPNTAVTL